LIRLPEELWSRLHDYKDEHGRSVRAICEGAIRFWWTWRDLNLPKDLNAQIREYAKKNKRPVGSVLQEAIEFAWKRRKDWQQPKVTNKKPS
jgi:predicted DNA-binding protein